MRLRDRSDQRVLRLIGIAPRFREGFAHRIQRGGRGAVRILVRAEPDVAFDRWRRHGEQRFHRDQGGENGGSGAGAGGACKCAAGEVHDGLLTQVWKRKEYTPARIRYLTRCEKRNTVCASVQNEVQKNLGGKGGGG